MQLDKKSLSVISKRLGFIRDTFEKVYRLVEVLELFENQSLISSSVALKGGTAINLLFSNLPRLSVDIDLDFVKSTTKELMLQERDKLTSTIKTLMTNQGYSLSSKSKTYHALDSFVFEYTNQGGLIISRSKSIIC